MPKRAALRTALWFPALIEAIFTTAMQAEAAGFQREAAIQPGDTLTRQMIEFTDPFREGPSGA